MNKTPLAKEHKQMLFVVCLAAFIVSLDFNVLNVALPTIAREFHIGLSLVSWTLISYVMTLTCLMPLSGKLVDLIDERKLLFAGFLLFGIGSFLCGLSQNIYMLIIFRVFQGLGAPVMMLIGGAIIPRTVPEVQRARTFGLFATILCFGICVGPALGGIITQYCGWRYIFFLNIPLCFAGLFFLGKLRCSVPEADEPGERIDYLGTFLSIFFLLAFVFGLNQGQKLGWKSPAIITILSVSIASFIAFIMRMRSAKYPLMDLSLFKARNFLLGNLNFLFFMDHFRRSLFSLSIFLRAK